MWSEVSPRLTRGANEGSKQGKTGDRRMPFQRYRPAAPVRLADRTWPDKRIERAPRWLSTDLRDGNQALPEPMTPQRKLRMFNLLVNMGYKEIEVGYPAASRDDYDFVRLLIDQDLIPLGVQISVMTPARDDLIDLTVQSLIGARNATVHLYNATAPFFRRVVYGIDRDACRELATRGTRRVIRAAESFLGDCELGFQYSPEVFTETELEFALEICSEVSEVWNPGPGREIILNFPATVERATPNVFADQVEWLDRHLPRRAHTCLSIHPHNDRGTGVAAAELAMMAGAQRIEGCLFGQGERCGNVCLVTLGMNLFSHGVDPEIDFTDLQEARRTVEACTRMGVHDRHPYAGELVYTAFSGAHQDAIKKGFDEMAEAAAAAGSEAAEMPWQMPYLPIDPKDVGRSYDAMIRVNSQSGKGGVGYIMRAVHGFDLPRGLQIEFSRIVQSHAEDSTSEVTSDQLLHLFNREYRTPDHLNALLTRCAAQHPGLSVGNLTVKVRDLRRQIPAAADGNVTEEIARQISALGVTVTVAETRSSDAPEEGVVIYARCVTGTSRWGVGVARNVRDASLMAVLSAVTRSQQVGSEKGNYASCRTSGVDIARQMPAEPYPAAS